MVAADKSDELVMTLYVCKRKRLNRFSVVAYSPAEGTVNVYLSKMPLLIECRYYSRLFREWATPDHIIVYVLFGSGVTI